MMPPTHNPFRAPAAGDAVTGQSRPASRPEPVERVDKPWGHEEIFAILEGSYVGKVLHVNAGGVLSLQEHLEKDETIAVQSGRITVVHGPDRDHLATVTLKAGERMLIRARVIHRISAQVDSVVLETSTAHSGWRTDVVRLEDRYGRQGTHTA
jgi:mannose-6-phosphate isomerase-like protein (cupin superfamily)